MTLSAYRAMTPDELLNAWRRGRLELIAAAASVAPDARIEWYGPSMSKRSFLTARLMEAWAHGQDVVDAIGAERPATDRLRHVAQLGVITRGRSYKNRGLEAPAGDVRVELAAPSGDMWTWGDADVDDSVSGPAEDFCLVVTQRRHVDDTRPRGSRTAGPRVDGVCPGVRRAGDQRPRGEEDARMKTAITDMFGIDLPILAFTHCRDVVAAVSKAGGMGVLGAVAHSDRQLEIDLDWIEAELGDRPYGVDLIVPAKYAGSDEGGLTMTTSAGHDPRRATASSSTTSSTATASPNCRPTPVVAALVGGSEAAPFSAEPRRPAARDRAGAPTGAARQRPRPAAGAHDRTRQAGRPRWSARWRAGCPARRAPCQRRRRRDHRPGLRGRRAHRRDRHDGAHPRDRRRRRRTIPVLGAGGIGRGRQMAAAMALGAQGVWCGSVWLTTDEAETHPVVKEKFLARHVVRHHPVAVAHRQAGATAEVGMDRGVGRDPDTPDQRWACRCNRSSSTKRSAASTAPPTDPGSGAEQLANYYVGQIVGRDERVQARQPRRLRDDRRVHRRSRTPRPDHERIGG